MDVKTAKMHANIHPLLSHYQLGEFLGISRAEGGFTNENYIVETAAGKFFLKKYLRANEERITREHKLLEYLKNEFFPVPALILNNNSQTLTELCGDLYTFFEFVPGYTRVATNSVSETEIGNLAKNLARYHYLAKNISTSIEPLVPIANKNYLENLYGQVKGILRNKRALDDFDQKISSVLDAKTEELAAISDTLEAGLPSLLTHGDFHAANIKFNQNGDVAAILDWELSKRQPRVWEVISAMVFCAKKDWTWNFHTPLDFGRAEKFLSAYNEINPLSSEEINALPAIMHAASADITWPLKEHYIHNNFDSDRFLPAKPENWFFWNDENIAKLKKTALASLPQPKLI